MIQLAVEKIGKHKFQIFEPIDAWNEEDEGPGTSRVHGSLQKPFFESLDWHRGSESSRQGCTLFLISAKRLSSTQHQVVILPRGCQQLPMLS